MKIPKKRYWCKNGCGKKVYSIKIGFHNISFICPMCKRKYKTTKGSEAI